MQKYSNQNYIIHNNYIVLRGFGTYLSFYYFMNTLINVDLLEDNHPNLFRVIRCCEDRNEYTTITSKWREYCPLCNNIFR